MQHTFLLIKLVEEIAKVHPTEIIINDLNFIPKLQKYSNNKQYIYK